MKILEKNQTADTDICPITQFMERIGGKWKPAIIWLLLKNGTMRFNDLEKSINGITQKVLSQQLKSLEAESIITRVSYPVVPPKVEYSLTEKGKSLFEMLQSILDWSKLNLK
jgi:DNA-binding HxlR family transcriptional regulator